MNPLGDDLLAYLVLAFGGAMAIGTALALLRPPDDQDAAATSAKAGAQPAQKASPKPGAKGPARRGPGPAADRAPMLRSLLFIVVGAVAAIWAAASLLSK
jgi:hypothetical protein